MKIVLITLMAGPDGVFQPGQDLNLPAKKARELIKAGFAVPVVRPKPKARPKKEMAADGRREMRAEE